MSEGGGGKALEWWDTVRKKDEGAGGRNTHTHTHTMDLSSLKSWRSDGAFPLGPQGGRVLGEMAGISAWWHTVTEAVWVWSRRESAISMWCHLSSQERLQAGDPGWGGCYDSGRPERPAERWAGRSPACWLMSTSGELGASGIRYGVGLCHFPSFLAQRNLCIPFSMCPTWRSSQISPCGGFPLSTASRHRPCWDSWGLILLFSWLQFKDWGFCIIWWKVFHP